MAKRTKQTQEMIETVNNILRINRVIDITDSDFSLMCYLLQSQNLYKGFNWFYDKVDDMGGYYPVLTGTSNIDELKELDAYLQIY